MTDVRVTNEGYGKKVFLKTDGVEIEIDKVIDVDIKGIGYDDYAKVTITFYPSKITVF